ncbi:hypothetical protein Q674_02220 [Acinetobacter sp. COS3]|nr:hypothetical protein Q674_02220 [Acinetobacter sp. COS3]
MNRGVKSRLNKAAYALDSFDLDKLLISTSAILKQNIAHAFSSYSLRLIQIFKHILFIFLLTQTFR